ncbi:MAG: hypothetical protein AB1411_02505 [Nitrospirota bacterium]
MVRTGVLVVAAVMLVLPLLMVASAYAGTDTTFDEIAQTVRGWMQGSLGMVLSLFGGILGVGSAVKGDWAGLGTGIGIAAGSYYIPNVLPSIITGLM